MSDPIPTTDDITEGMAEDDNRRFEQIAKTLIGMNANRAVALLMCVVCSVIDEASAPGLWDGIARGAKKEMKLARKARGRVH